MYQIKNILVPFNFSDVSYFGLKAASKLAEKVDSKISFVHFFIPNGAMAPTQPPDTSSGRSTTAQEVLYHNRLEEEKDNLTKHLEKVMSDRVDVKNQGKVYVVDGTLPEDFEDFAREIEPDLIISGTSGSRSLLEYFSGSNTEKIIRRTNIPIIAISGKDDIVTKNVLVATDLSKAIPDKNFKICQLLEKLGSKIHLVNVITTELLTEEDVADRLHFLAKKFELENYEIHVKFNNDEIKGILKVADEIDAGLMLMKTYQKSAFWSFLSGSLAEKMVRKTQRPVVVQKVKKKIVR